MLPLAVLFSALMIGPAFAAGSTPCPQAFGSFSSSSFPAACWRPYGPSSPFNHPLPANPTLAPNSSAIVSNLTANGVNFEGGGTQFAFTSDDGRDGVYYSQASDPTVTIHCTYQWGPGTCAGTDKVNVDGQQIHIPAGAQPQNNGSDMHMSIVDQANNLEYDFEHATWSSDHKTLNVWSGAEIPAGANTGTGLGGGGTAAGFSTVAGLITAPELAAGAINHALVINVPCTNGVVYPAQQAHGLACSQLQNQKNTGTPTPLGTLFQLNMTDAQIAATGAPAWEKTIMTAMAHYGMYVNDTDGIDNIQLEAQSDISYTSLGGAAVLSNLIASNGGYFYSPLNRWIMTGPTIPVDKLRVVDPCFAQGLCNTDSSTTTPPATTSTTPPPPLTTTSTTPAPPTTTTTTSNTPVATAIPVTTTVPTASSPAPPAPTSAKPAPTRPKTTGSPKRDPRKPVKAPRRTLVVHVATVSCKASTRRQHARSGAKRNGGCIITLRRPPARRHA